MAQRIFNGAAIDRLRRAKGWTYRVLANRIDCTQQSCIAWVQGQQEPKATMLAAIADALETDIDSLFKKARGGR